MSDNCIMEWLLLRSNWSTKPFNHSSTWGLATFSYRNDPKFSDRKVWANSTDPDQTAPEEQSDQGLHCLLFHLHHFDKIPLKV